jgi:hypothetical protein
MITGILAPGKAALAGGADDADEPHVNKEALDVNAV